MTSTLQLDGVGKIVMFEAAIRAPWRAVASTPAVALPAAPPADALVAFAAELGTIDGPPFDPFRHDPLPAPMLLELLDLAPGATAEQIREKLKLVIGRACQCHSTGAEHLAILGVATAWDLGQDGFVHARDLAGIAGHPSPETLKEAEAWKFIRDQLGAQGRGLVKFYDLGQLLRMYPSASKEEIVERFRELALQLKTETLSATQAHRMRAILFGVQALRSPTTNGITDLARAIHAHRSEAQPAPIALSADPTVRELTGLKRSIAAAKHEHKAEPKPKIIKLSAAHGHLTGLDRALAAHVLNPND